jgi:PAS domain-containing protein
MNERSKIFALRKDGTEFLADASISRSGEGDGIVFTAILRDVSAQENSRLKLENALSLLQATFEATADGIIAIDKSKRITNLNRKFIEMWQIPDSVPETQDFKRLLEHVLAMAKEPESILEKVRQMEENPEKESRDFIEFKDGRIFERYCNPQQIGDEIVGNVCSFRDITEYRRLVDSLNESLSRLSKKNRYESMISSINRSVSESYNLQEILDRIVDAMSKNIEASDIISIYFVEGQEAVLSL